MKPVVRTIHSQPSWILQNDQVELALTCLGGHMAPVTFGREKEPFQPYYISPWQEQGLDIDVPVLRPLRGDFFCMPFGSNAEPWRSVQYPPHGEPAGAPWTFVSQQRKGGTVSLTVEMETKVRPGYLSKTLSLVDRHHAVYSEHVLSGFWRGAMPVGHHCTLAVTDRPGGMYVCTSPMRFGMTCPTLFSNPAIGEYQSMAIGQKFDDLRRVPLLWKDPPEGDFALLPARKGFTDLLGVVSQPGKLAWTIVVNRFDRYLWFSLRDPTVLPTTMLWVANQGRHTFPWNRVKPWSFMRLDP